MIKVNLDKDPVTIQSMFGKIASRYDLANNIVSLKLHNLWNRRLTDSLAHYNSLLDVCAGTGEIAYLWLNRHKSPKQVFLLDFCEEMLDAAKAKSLPYMVSGHQLHYLHADATNIPLPPQSIEAVSLAYGIRNVQNPLSCFQEVNRVLIPGGKFAILELTSPKNKALRVGHQFYLNRILPWLGGLITREKNAYMYLAKSIQAFTQPEELKKLLVKAEFHKVEIQPLTGGIATLITAYK